MLASRALDSPGGPELNWDPLEGVIQTVLVT